MARIPAWKVGRNVLPRTRRSRGRGPALRGAPRAAAAHPSSPVPAPAMVVGGPGGWRRTAKRTSRGRRGYIGAHPPPPLVSLPTAVRLGARVCSTCQSPSLMAPLSLQSYILATELWRRRPARCVTPRRRTSRGKEMGCSLSYDDRILRWAGGGGKHPIRAPQSLRESPLAPFFYACFCTCDRLDAALVAPAFPSPIWCVPPPVVVPSLSFSLVSFSPLGHPKRSRGSAPPFVDGRPVLHLHYRPRGRGCGALGAGGPPL